MFIKIKVFPGFKKNEIIKKSEGSFDVKVREKPKQGKANQAVIKILASYLKLPKEKIKLIKGFKEKNKIFEIKTIK